MPTARAALSSSVVNGIIYAMGGATGNILLATMEAYNPATDSWTTKASVPNAFYFGSSAAVNGTLYAIGGIDGVIVANVWAYDPTSDAWSARAPMSAPRDGMSSGVLNGFLLNFR